jgi:hypothetical protein
MSVQLRIDTVDISNLANMIGAAGKRAPAGFARALNRTGMKARTAMIKGLTAQTGLKPKVVRRALRSKKAHKANLAFTVESAGGNIALKYFSPRETRKGVSAAPFGKRRVFASTFMKAGWWPGRVVKGNWNGQVFKRTGVTKKTEAHPDGMDQFERQKSGVIIPQEMVQGATEAAFFNVAQRELPGDLAHELGLILSGHQFKSKGGKVF